MKTICFCLVLFLYLFVSITTDANQGSNADSRLNVSSSVYPPHLLWWYTAENPADVIRDELREREDLMRRLREAHTYDVFHKLEIDSRKYSDLHEVVIIMWDLEYIDKAKAKMDVKELEKLLKEVYPSRDAYKFIKDKIEKLNKKPKQ